MGDAAADHLPPSEDPRVPATLDDLQPGTAVLIDKGTAGPAEMFHSVIHSVDGVENRTFPQHVRRR